MLPKIATQIITDTTKAYDSISEHFSSTRQYNWTEIKIITDKYVKSDSSILDLGCGNGRLLSILPDQIEYTGVDISKYLIKEAKKYSRTHRKAKQKISFQVDSLMDFKTEKKYDYIFAIASLHHIPSESFRKKVLQNIFSFLKPGGLFICTNWQLDQTKYQSCCNFSKKILPDLDQNDCLIPWKNSNKEILAQRYYHSFTEEEIGKTLSSTGFKILKNYTERHNIITISKKHKHP
ncbi:MAG: class I SAM-dependent methyltransferase [Patescibacteria group bacterium]